MRTNILINAKLGACKITLLLPIDGFIIRHSSRVFRDDDGKETAVSENEIFTTGGKSCGTCTDEEFKRIILALTKEDSDEQAKAN